ncbi:MAG: hypothetical protein ABMA13_10255 [Chthoniobacteraceae bacterium]
MKTSTRAIIVILLSLGVLAHAQNAAPSLDGALQPPPKPNEEMVKWIETVDAQWQATFAKEVTAPFDAEKAKVAQQYSAGIEANLARVTAVGNLDLTVQWRDERDRFASAKDVPVVDDASAPAELKQLRATWRTQMERIEKDRAERMKSVQSRYDQVLAQAQTALTQRQRIEDALMVKSKRDEVAARWLTAPTASVSTVSVVSAPASAPATSDAAKDPMAMLIGTWRLTNPENGWSGTRTFKIDGTFTTEKANGIGKWEVVGDRVSVAYADGTKDQILLPLDPNGTNWMISRGRTINAVKESSAAATSPGPRGVVSPAKATPAASSTANVAALKALFTGSRWQWFDGAELKGKPYWVEFYRNGAMYSQWGEAYHWEIVSPSTIKITGGNSGKAEWFLLVDMTKKEARPDPNLNRTGARSIRYEKSVSSSPPKGIKF